MKFLAILLSMIVITLAIVPCCNEDNCEDGLLSEQTDKKSSEEPECPCSPFVSCTSCTGVYVTPSIESVVAPVINVEKTLTLYKQSFVSFYSATIWQPPKIAC
jgi:hypothetical protein